MPAKVLGVGWLRCRLWSEFRLNAQFKPRGWILQHREKILILWHLILKTQAGRTWQQQSPHLKDTNHLPHLPLRSLFSLERRLASSSVSESQTQILLPRLRHRLANISCQPVLQLHPGPPPPRFALLWKVLVWCFHCINAAHFFSLFIHFGSAYLFTGHSTTTSVFLPIYTFTGIRKPVWSSTF